MPIKKPSYSDIVNRNRSTVVSYLPEIDPTIFSSITRMLIDSLAGRSFDHVQLFSQLEKNSFPDTAEGDFLARWAAYEVISRKEASGSKGYIDIVGTTGLTIPAGTSFNSKAGNIYFLDQDVILAENEISILSITEDAGVATATSAEPHGYGTGLTITISGASPAEYNGTFEITALSGTTFSYSVPTPLVDATGTIISSFTGGFGFIESEKLEGETENTVNLGNSSQLTLSSPIAGVEDISYVQFDGITGGLLAETDNALRDRVYQSRNNPVANFNVTRIEKTALGVVGVTRVKVKRTYPETGDVTVLFVRDNDPESIFPSQAQIDEVKNAILGYLPANSAESGIYVDAPVPVSVSFEFSSIDPDAPTMRQAIIDNLSAFFEDQIDFEDDVKKNLYLAAIGDTIDLSTGQRLATFDLISPTADVVVGDLKLGILGEVSF